ncbi:MotA/TolQ/ExbB proton channel family protein [Paraburkholderia caballeronis]|uniref:Biopolymer transport protein ExbB n=1 Tax=Paraburkholderia caballeronis TaxID=416943 RepID=A0A1H7TF04_9BURK|nr:MotA/TolQ/ExbB proton channel family protein [Paraburkholderia caballeronis]PXW18325.1 outer membrane transport energization protein ExbB [Paraburkholderia caballeronis]PXW95605.1 outer membrane transport energization protein ExbB [Paraburkholderia caballeronis]RAJ91951.1 outer membrane transport energization protein ExbB [Paraburkholderia caballeronis]TDV02942.1 outer membrane transport energization protein ExbB [Paraburkholderia caballeronis]TDV06884.1 outer membrane transport energizatio
MNVGIWEMWDRGDVISHGIAVVLIVMSIASWAVLLYKVAQLLRMKAQGALVARRFWKAESLEDGAAQLGKPSEGNPYQRLVEAAREARKRHDDASLQEALSPDEWLQRCLGVAFEEQAGRMATGLGVLASVGSTAPFVGLFGTVWGIYHALLGISAAGQSSLAQVAGPVGEALVMTALGLFVAIPAVLGYNAVSRGNRSVLHRLARFRHELHAYLISGERRRADAKRRPTHHELVAAGEC